MKISLWGRLVAVCMAACFVLWMPSVNLELSAQGSSDAEVQQIAAALDTNGNQVLDDTEIRQAIQLWIGGSAVPDTNLTISDAAILKLIQLWISGQPITAEPPAPPTTPPPSGTFQIEGIFLLDFDSEGLVVVNGPSLQSASTGTLITITGNQMPSEPVVHFDDQEVRVSAINEGTLLTFVPNVGTASKSVDIIVSDKNDSGVQATKRFTINPLNIDQVVDPERTILDFISAVRTALANEPSSSEVNESLQLLDELENALPIMSEAESRSIAAGIEAADALAMLNKLQKTQRATAASLGQHFGPEEEPWISPDVGGIVAIIHIGMLKYSNPGPTISIIDLSNQAPVEGEPQSLTCLAKNTYEIDFIRVGIGRSTTLYGGTFLSDENGNPLPGEKGEGVDIRHRYAADKISEQLTVQWNSEVTGQSGDILIHCLAGSAPIWVNEVETEKRLTLPIKAAPTPEPIPDTAPSIINLATPIKVAGDGQAQEVFIDFEDPNGDLATLSVLTTEGPNAGNPAQTLALSNVSGLTTGTTSYSISCTNTGTDPFNVTQQVVLVDAKGLESDPKTYTYTCEGTGSPEPPPVENTSPTILDIDALGFFPGDGAPHEVTVTFSDQNKNVNQIKIEITDGPNAGGPPVIDTVPPAADFTGTYNFNVSCNNPDTQFFNVSYRVTVTDAGGLESEPKLFGFTCEPTGTP